MANELNDNTLGDSIAGHARRLVEPVSPSEIDNAIAEIREWPAGYEARVGDDGSLSAPHHPLGIEGLADELARTTRISEISSRIIEGLAAGLDVDLGPYDNKEGLQRSMVDVVHYLVSLVTKNEEPKSE